MDKAAIKRAYKETKQPMGVYIIKNSKNDKVFIGCAVNLEARFNRHRAELKFGSHRNKELQKIWDSLGESAFEFEILDILDHENKIQADADEELHLLEDMWVQKLEKAGNLVTRL